MKRTQLVFVMILALCFAVDRNYSQSEKQSDTTAITVMLRFDDIGMCHGLNSAIGEVASTGVPISVSVMFACPWYQEAVPILKQFPNVSVGVHLVLNSEWKNYRWGPVSGPGSVPSLVDSDGYFFPTRAMFTANNPRVEEVEKELRAQIGRAERSGLRIDYLDYHMGAAVQTPEFRAIVEKLAKEYHVGISRYFGERGADGLYKAPIDEKTDTLMRIANSLTPGVRWLFVFHIGLETPEMDALVDMNTFGLPDVSKNRNAERKAVLSDRFQSLIHSPKFQLRSYYDVIRESGLESMRRPELDQ